MPQTDGIGIDEMWWTVITLTAVAGWFEWVYRHDRGRGKAEKSPPSPPVSTLDRTESEQTSEASKAGDIPNGTNQCVET